ncbi:MAG: hypothetical protein IPM93_08140 [Candidatus Obscuribacter sp.]|nr:hypothetical protein [Candidatus Obscuribacter sp.]
MKDQRALKAKSLLLVTMQLGLSVLLAVPPCSAAENRPETTTTTTTTTTTETETETAAGRSLSYVNRAILLQLIKLARFNIRFHQEANRHQKWRTYAYASGREAGTAVSLASSLIDLKQRIRGLDDPSLISRNAQKNAVITSLIGNSISGSASGLELAQNSFMMLRARKLGYSPGDSLAFVKKIVETTDALFTERAQIIQRSTINLEARQDFYSLEERLMRRIRQQLLFEFCNWSCHSRDLAWRENIFYSLDALQNYTRVSASIVALKGFSQPNLGGAVAISTVVANSTATINPLLASLVGLTLRKYQHRKLAHELQIERPANADFSLVDLAMNSKDLPEETESKLLQEVAVLGDQSERLDRALDRENGDIERYRRVAQQQTIAGPLIGLTSIPGAVLGTLAFYNYQDNRDATNKMLFAGRLSTLSGQTYALIQTPATIIAGAIKARKLKKTGQHPAQLLDARLKNLAILEEKLRMTAP